MCGEENKVHRNSSKNMEMIIDKHQEEDSEAQTHLHRRKWKERETTENSWIQSSLKMTHVIKKAHCKLHFMKTLRKTASMELQ